MPTALVTGGSRGFGRVIAMRLASDGHQVAINYAHDTTAADRVVADIAAAGGQARAFRFDVTDEAALSTGMAAVRDGLGEPDIVVNNAVGPHDTIPLEEQTWDDHWAQIRFCVKAPVLMVQNIARPWKQRGAGTLINIGSEVHDIGNAEFAHYVGAKSAMVGLTRSWARDLGPHGITVNLVAPGFIPVERHEDMDKAGMIEAYLPHLPFHRMGQAADIAAGVSFLASSDASFMNGQTLTINGGRTFT
ncbi:MAG: SDR family NAD(P)-dependent oxidoreductase [Beutenbergiaceae bacterium]